MEEGGSAQSVQLILVCYTQSLRQSHRIPLYAADVSVRDLILCVNRERKRFNGS
jgi:hypothetical protein